MLHQVVGELLGFVGESVGALCVAIFQGGMGPRHVVPDLPNGFLLARVERPPGDLLKIGFYGREELLGILALMAGLRLRHAGNKLRGGLRSAALPDHDFVRRPGMRGRKVFMGDGLALVGG